MQSAPALCATVAFLLLLVAPAPPLHAQLAGDARHSAANTISVATATPFPSPETLSYTVEWRLWYAGNARVTLRPHQNQQWQSEVHVESAGMVSKLFNVNDNYTADLNSQFCADNARLDAAEGKRHRLTTVRFDYRRGKASYNERDLQKNTTIKTAETEIPSCVTDVIGALLRLRMLHLQPGQSAQIPVSNGTKSANVRVEAQQREEVETKLGKFKAIRYEANIFNGVLYSRSARMFVWLTDDARHLPVQIRLRMQLVIGTITLTLDKEEHSPGGLAQAASFAPGKP